MSELTKAIAIAEAAHAGQVDKAGAPYILHPKRVMAAMQTDRDRIVAVLHDAIEDTTVTFAQLEAEGFDSEILAALDSVTRREGESYREFVLRAGDNEIGTRVKLADLNDNRDLKRIENPTQVDHERVAKYEGAMKVLEGILAERLRDPGQDSKGPKRAP